MNEEYQIKLHVDEFKVEYHTCGSHEVLITIPIEEYRIEEVVEQLRKQADNIELKGKGVNNE